MAQTKKCGERGIKSAWLRIWRAGAFSLVCVVKKHASGRKQSKYAWRADLAYGVLGWLGLWVWQI